MVDGYQASFEATNLLIEKGCKRIGLLLYESLHSHMSERKYGYMDALQRSGLYDPELTGYVKFNNLEKEISGEITHLLDKKIDGLFAVTNSIAMYAVKELLKRGIKIPWQVHVVGFDKSDAFEFMEIPIPYVQQPIEQMGRRAVDLLLKQMTGQESTTQVSKFPATLIRRGVD
jgi:LacI family transcriptional regulator